MKWTDPGQQLYRSIPRNKRQRGKLLKFCNAPSASPSLRRKSRQNIKALIALFPLLLCLLGHLGCGGGIGLFSGQGGGATGNTPEDRRSGGSNTSDVGSGNPGSGNPLFDGAGETGLNPNDTGNNDLSGGGTGAASQLRSNSGQQVVSGQNWVGIGNEGHVVVQPWLFAVVIPPSGSADPQSCRNWEAAPQNFIGSQPTIVVGFGPSAQGPWEHFEKFPADMPCGIRSINCHYWIYENKGGYLGIQQMKVQTDFVRLQAFYTAKSGDLFYPYTNPAQEIPDPFNLGLNPPKPELSGKYQSDVITLDCKQLAQEREEKGLGFEHIETLPLKVPEPTQMMMMPPR